MLPLMHSVQLVPREETPHDHYTSISTGERPICNLRFADDIDLMGSSNGKLQDLINRLVDRATALRLEVSTEKSKIMTNSTNNTTADISLNGQKLEGVTTFKYLGATLCKDCLLYTSPSPRDSA